MVSKSTEYYHSHPEARERKKSYDTKFESSPAQKAKRRELEKANREHDAKYGKTSRQGKNANHTKNGIVCKNSSANRGSKTDSAGDRRARGGR